MSTNTSVPTREQRSASLYNYIRAKFPQFMARDAAAVVDAVHPAPNESIQQLARRVQNELAKHGVNIKHTSALQAAARVQSLSDWHKVRLEAPALRGLEVSILDTAKPELHDGWRDAIQSVINACDSWLSNHPASRVIALNVRTNCLAFTGVLDGEQQTHPTLGPSTEPIAIVRPKMDRTSWLDGARGALERLRRHVEQGRRAMLDGYALVDFCTGDGSLDLLGLTAIGIVDVPNAELILLRADNPLDIGYEIMRGDEIACLFQLDLGIESERAMMGVNEEDGAWECGNSRFLWEIAVLRPDESPPGLFRRNLTVAESRKLLQRYTLAKRIFSTGLPERHAPKRVATLDTPPEFCRLDVHRTARAFVDAGLDWQTYLKERGEEDASKGIVSMGFLVGLADTLALNDPDSLLARPPRGELIRVTDDAILRALIPRVHHVRYRCPSGLESERKEVLEEAIATFCASFALRRGMFPTKDQLPQVVYSEDAEELRTTLQDVGLVMHVGVLPHLKLIPEALRPSIPGISRFAFGYSLFIDVDFEAVAA